jgi:hypothetical protein
MKIGDDQENQTPKNRISEEQILITKGWILSLEVWWLLLIFIYKENSFI